MNKTTKIVLIVLGALLLIALLLVGWVVGTYNSLVTADENVNQKWANVQSAYQRRADLIPNLVDTVQEVVEFEQETQTQIAALRSQAVAAKQALDSADSPEETMAAIRQVDNVGQKYSGLNINVENYPQLRSNENFLSLQDELAGTENRVKVERDLYNQAVREYNVMVRRVPSNIIAAIFGFGQKDMFEAEEGADTAPDVGGLFDS